MLHVKEWLQEAVFREERTPEVTPGIKQWLQEPVFREERTPEVPAGGKQWFENHLSG